MTEIWKDIPAYKGRYQASSLGRVKSLTRVITSRTKDGVEYFKKVQGRVLKLSHRKDRRLKLNLEKKTHKVHRLIAFAFLGKPFEGAEINHKDRDCQNNCVENLEWCTKEDNTKHATETGVNRGEKNGQSKLNKFQVKRIRLIKQISPRISQKKLGSMFGVCRQTISSILNQETWVHITDL